MLQASWNIFTGFVQSTLFSYFFGPLFAIGILTVLIEVIKYVCHFK